MVLSPIGVAERNNVKTRNFQRLLYQAAVNVRNVRSSTTILGATNALTISRIVLKHLSENLNASQLVTFLNLPVSITQEDLPEGLGQGLPSLCIWWVVVVPGRRCSSGKAIVSRRIKAFYGVWGVVLVSHTRERLLLLPILTLPWESLAHGSFA